MQYSTLSWRYHDDQYHDDDGAIDDNDDADTDDDLFSPYYSSLP